VKVGQDFNARLWKSRLTEEILEECVGDAMNWEPSTQSRYLDLMDAVGEYATRLGNLIYGEINLREYNFWVRFKDFRAQLERAKAVTRAATDPAWDDTEQARARVVELTAQLEAALGLTLGQLPDPGPPAEDPDIAVVRELLLAAFSAEELRQLVTYTSVTELRPLVQRFSSRASLGEIVYETIEYCQTRALLPELLTEVQQANPRQYARFAPRLRG
jgi:hypothetical protein